MRWYKDLTVEKDPSDVIDYELDFSGLLQDDTISTATTATENITVDSVTITGNKVSIFVSGGSAGCTGKITVTIVTTNATPRTYERSFFVRVFEF